MVEGYHDFVMRNLAQAENALFELRNAYYGYDDATGRKVDHMRRQVEELARKEARKDGGN